MSDFNITRIRHPVCSKWKYWLVVVVVGSGAAPFSVLSLARSSLSDLPCKTPTSLICLQSVSLYHVVEREEPPLLSFTRY